MTEEVTTEKVVFDELVVPEQVEENTTSDSCKDLEVEETPPAFEKETLIEDCNSAENMEISDDVPLESEVGNNYSNCCLDETATVHAMAIIEDSINVTLAEEEMNAMRKIIFGKEHLAKNIIDLKIKYLSTRELRRKFKHTAEVIIQVNTANLLDRPRNHIWKHIGNNAWRSKNGTEIQFVKIHQK